MPSPSSKRVRTTGNALEAPSEPSSLLLSADRDVLSTILDFASTRDVLSGLVPTGKDVRTAVQAALLHAHVRKLGPPPPPFLDTFPHLHSLSLTLDISKGFLSVNPCLRISSRCPIDRIRIETWNITIQI